MKKFDDWWYSIYADKPKMIHRQCYEEGYEQRNAEIKALFLTSLSVAIVVGIAVFLVGCQDHYRYPCQNPDNFYKAECQKPKCLFTQMCPEYLVAPILEKQIAQPNQSASEPNAGK